MQLRYQRLMGSKCQMLHITHVKCFLLGTTDKQVCMWIVLTDGVTCTLPSITALQPIILHAVSAQSSFNNMHRWRGRSYRGCLGMEGSQPVLEGVDIVILPSNQGLPSQIIHARSLGRLELFVIRPAAGGVYKPP